MCSDTPTAFTAGAPRNTISDEPQARSNPARHGTTFEEASTVFGDPLSLTIPDACMTIMLGEHRQVAIARALINEPELILADEPTGNLDSHAGEEIIQLLCDLRAERVATLLIATHNDRVAALLPKVVELIDSQITSNSPST